MNSVLDLMRDSTRERQESRGSVMRELENRRRMEAEEREERLERDRMRHLELMAVLTRGPLPQPPLVTITHSRPSNDLVVKLKVESVQQLTRSLRSTFDPDGEKIFLQEDIGHPEYLVTDVSTMDWPEKLELNMSERLVGGTNTKVFSLRPQL